MAILIAGLGLFSLASLAVSRRKKEMSIHKVFGAASRDVARLAVREFFLLAGIALVLAVPIGYLIGGKVFSGYLHQIAVSPATFFATGLVAMLITLACVGFQAYRTARVNPIEHLRYE